MRRQTSRARSGISIAMANVVNMRAAGLVAAAAAADGADPGAVAAVAADLAVAGADRGGRVFGNQGNETRESGGQTPSRFHFNKFQLF